jgi:hypothetical protein
MYTTRKPTAECVGSLTQVPVTTAGPSVVVLTSFLL